MDKRMIKRKQFWSLIILIVVLVIILAVVSFFLADSLVPRFTLWSNLIFGTGALITSIIAISISVLSLQREEKYRKQKISDDANKFIKENNDEILYIPLCLIANSYDNHHKFCRRIYNEFNVLNRETQKEVLKQLNYDYELLYRSNWIDAGIDFVISYIKENEIGRNLLYDGAKYFHRAMKYPSEEFDHRCEYAHIMPDYFNWNPKIFFQENKALQENVSFDTYLNAYLYEKSKESILYKKYKSEKPIDLLAAIVNFGECPEDYACYWVMQIVLSVSLRIIRETNKGIETEINYLSSGDAEIETFEDRYLEVLLELYNLVITKQKKNK